MTRRNQRAARFGPAWWGRYGHTSSVRDGQVVTRGAASRNAVELFEWPRPCVVCVELVADDVRSGRIREMAEQVVAENREALTILADR